MNNDLISSLARGLRHTALSRGTGHIDVVGIQDLNVAIITGALVRINSINTQAIIMTSILERAVIDVHTPLLTRRIKYTLISTVAVADIVLISVLLKRRACIRTRPMRSAVMHTAIVDRDHGRCSGIRASGAAGDGENRIAAVVRVIVGGEGITGVGVISVHLWVMPVRGSAHNLNSGVRNNWKKTTCDRIALLRLLHEL
jgi:hypothetical protein